MEPKDKVTVELSDEMKGQFEEMGKSVNLIKEDSLNAVESVKEEIKTQLNTHKEQIDKMEEQMNLIHVQGADSKKADPKAGFKNHIEFFNAVIQAGMPGNDMRPDKMPENLRPLFNAVGSDEARQSSNPDGGFLVPPAFLAGLMTTDPQALQIDTGALTRKVPMDADTIYLNARVDKDHSDSVSGGFRVYRREETGTVTASSASYEQIKLQANSLMGLSYASEEILSRSPVSYASLIQSGFADEKISKLNYERIWGTGVGEFTGIINSAALISVAKESNQTADTITATNILAMRARAWRYGGCVWMANHDCLTQLMAAYIAVGTAGGVPIFMPGNGTDKPDTLLGRPIIFDENMGTLGDLGDIACVNWNEYLEGNLGGASFEESIHVRFVYNERAFRFVVYNDGQPWWRSALTPKKSTVTLSPFVSLAARA